jgi:uncharacterized protein (DUF1810 family)
MTLFAACAEDPQLYQQALDKYFSGRGDSKTLALLGPGRGSPSGLHRF